MVGTVAGFAAGFASSGFALLLILFKMCPAQIRGWGEITGPGDAIAYVVQSAFIGAAQGALIGAVAGLAAGLAAPAGALASGAAGIGAGLIASQLFFGALESGWKMLQRHDLCEIVPAVVGLVAGFAVGWEVNRRLGPIRPGGGCPECEDGGEPSVSGDETEPSVPSDETEPTVPGDETEPTVPSDETGPSGTGSGGGDQEILDQLPPRPGNEGPTAGILDCGGTETRSNVKRLGWSCTTNTQRHSRF